MRLRNDSKTQSQTHAEGAACPPRLPGALRAGRPLPGRRGLFQASAERFLFARWGAELPR